MEELVAKLRKIDSLIPTINSGGCAILAHAAYAYIKHKHPRMKDYEIVYLYQSYETSYVEQLEKDIPTTCSHAVLRIGNKYYDSDETVTKSYLIKQDLHVIPVTEDLVLASLKCSGWNRRFNRQYNVPIIIDTLGLPSELEHHYT